MYPQKTLIRRKVLDPDRLARIAARALAGEPYRGRGCAVQGHEVGIEIIRTTGDRLQEITFAQVGTKGMFTKEIEEALIEERIDLAVHSLKDLPTELAPEFVLAAIPERADPRDAFVSVEFNSFFELPAGCEGR